MRQSLASEREIPQPVTPQQTEPLSGTVERVVFANPGTGFTVARVSVGRGQEAVTIVGLLPPLREGEIVRCAGRWETDSSWGRQFRVSELDVVLPSTAEGLARYLASGIVPGLGERLAGRLAEHFGSRLGEVIVREPLRLREVPGLGPTLAARIVRHWQEESRGRDVLLFLHSHGLSMQRARNVLGAYGERAVARINDDPYALTRDIRGIGFKTADELAARLGVAPQAEVRLRAALEETLRQAAEQGDTAVVDDELTYRAEELLAAAPDSLAAALAAAVELGLIASVEKNARRLCALPLLVEAETRIAEQLVRLLRGRPRHLDGEPAARLEAAEAALGLSLAPSQAEALRQGLASKVMVITGGPGTGKTTLVRALLAAATDSGDSVALAAPTGRAAKRLAESTGREARTLHRLLEADPARGFRRDAGRQLEADLVVVDEASMIDVILMDALLAALPDHCRLFLVGDVDQLPPVGPGQPFADIIRTGAVPVVRLTEIFRQAAQSRIVRSAHRINAGEAPDLAREDPGATDFFAMRVDDTAAALERTVELVVDRIPQRFGLDPFTEIQVLCPTNRGAVGTRELNRVLRERMNPEPPDQIERAGMTFALGDKVMQIENDYEREVYNGDIGRVTRLARDRGELGVTFDGREVVYKLDALDQLRLAYAITVHKAQGSEYPAVVVVLLRQHGRMLRRRLLYTAITRARRLVVLVTEPSALERAVADASERPRRTLLEHYLREEGLIDGATGPGGTPRASD